MRAPRCFANSYSSRISTPAPSPTMKPSRSFSKGRLARSGSSLRVDSARSAPNPPIPIGVMAASDPPAIMIVAAPRLMISNASPMACADADRHLTRREIDDGGRNEERRDLARPPLEIGSVLALDRGEPADARGHEDADLRRNLRRHLDAGVVQRELRCRN